MISPPRPTQTNQQLLATSTFADTMARQHFVSCPHTLRTQFSLRLFRVSRTFDRTFSVLTFKCIYHFHISNTFRFIRTQQAAPHFETSRVCTAIGSMAFCIICCGWDITETRTLLIHNEVNRFSSSRGCLNTTSCFEQGSLSSVTASSHDGIPFSVNLSLLFQ